MAETFEPITTQEAFDTAIKGRLAAQEKAIRAEYADYKDLKARADGWDKAENGYKQQIADLTKERDTARRTTQKIKAARKYGINLDDADRLRGDSEEEIDADAKNWADAMRGRRTTQPAGSNDGGDNKNAAAKADALSALRELRGK